MDTAEEIKKKKLEELKKQQPQQESEEQQLQQQVQQLEAMVKPAFTKEALERYGNLKTAYPDRAVQLLTILAQALQAGRVQRIDDSTLKDILKRITPQKKDFNIRK